MTFDELLHCIRAAADVTGEIEVYVLGSQSILLHYQESLLPEASILSREADIATANNQTQNAYIISETFWEESDFARMFDLEIDGIQFDEISLPQGWKERTFDWTYDVDQNRQILVHAIDVHDAAASKVKVHREKDRKWIKALYNEGLLDMTTVFERLGLIDMDFDTLLYCQSSLQSIIDGKDIKW